MNEIELSWVAGLLEGEGCFTKKKQGTILSQLVVECHMTDKDVLEKLLNTVKTGTLNGPYKNSKPHHKLRYMWRVSGEKAYLLMKSLLPLMSSRRTIRIQELIKEYEAFKPKIYRFLHIESGRIEETLNAKEWYESHNLIESSLYRTMNGDRNSCHGWKRIE